MSAFMGFGSSGSAVWPNLYGSEVTVERAGLSKWDAEVYREASGESKTGALLRCSGCGEVLGCVPATCLVEESSPCLFKPHRMRRASTRSFLTQSYVASTPQSCLVWGNGRHVLL